jgi:hypothetical protein
MECTITLSDAARGTAGTLLLTILAVEFGGWYMLRILQRRVELTGFQRAFSRAGHAHAGVLVILSLVVQLYADAAGATGLLGSLGRSAVPLAAILMPAGFFLSSAGRGRTAPNALVALIYLGAASLGLGVAALGISLLTA